MHFHALQSIDALQSEIVPQPLCCLSGDHCGMQVTPTSTANGLLRLAAAARLAGLSPKVMVSAIERGQIPVGLVQLGSLRYVPADRFNQWLKSTLTPAPAADLFR